MRQTIFPQSLHQYSTRQSLRLLMSIQRRRTILAPKVRTLMIAATATVRVVTHRQRLPTMVTPALNYLGHYRMGVSRRPIDPASHGVWCMHQFASLGAGESQIGLSPL